jgi:predicted nuclease of restriction endonuclease-like (RecB) superfamily
VVVNIRLRFLSASGLETAIINTLEHFLLELGKGFLRLFVRGNLAEHDPKV